MEEQEKVERKDHSKELSELQHEGQWQDTNLESFYKLQFKH